MKKTAKPKVGDIVTIIVKPYNKNIKVKGVIKKILTKKLYHSRGIKVQLTNLIVGRIV